MSVHRASIVPVVAALLLLPGCKPFRRSRMPKTPPVVAPAPPAAESPTEPEPEPPEPPKELELPEPPRVEQPPIISIPAPPIQTAAPPAPPPSRKPSRQSAPPKPASAPAPESVEPAPAPRLTRLLTPEQQRDYNQQINESLDRVRQDLVILSRRSLTTEQSEVLERIHAFLQQTAETRKMDLVTASILAQRADLLAQGLERTTR